MLTPHKKPEATWKIPSDSIKGTQSWSVPWSETDDAALLVGIWRHGFNNWEAIQDDESLNLKGKMFLEPTRGGATDKQDTPTPGPDGVADKGKKTKKVNVPGPVHLVRRGDYLLLVLRDCESGSKMHKDTQAKKSVSNEASAAARPKKPKPSASASAIASGSANGAPAKREDSVSAGAAPTPPISKAIKREGSEAKATNGASHKQGTPIESKKTKPDKKEGSAKASPDKVKKEAAKESSSEEESDDDSPESGFSIAECKERLRTVKKDLYKLKDCATLPREEKVAVLTRCLLSVGDHITTLLKDPKALQKCTETHLWMATAMFWPVSGVQWSAIKAMCELTEA